MIAICAILFAVLALAAFAGCAIAPLLADETDLDPNRDREGAATLDFGPWTLDSPGGGLYL